MSTTIAISGKGGSGKTTVAAMIIRMLVDEAAKSQSVLAVDADPNSSLALTLGVETTGSIAEIREQTRAKQPSDGGMDRVRSFEYSLQQIITEAKEFDLVAMGQPEGPDCYCAVNNILRSFLDKLSSAYRFVVIDNEAGMEHLSRRTTNNVDLLCIVSEATAIGALTTRRIYKLAKQLPISVKQIGVIWNKSDAPKEIESIENLGFIPYDEELFQASILGKTVFDINADSSAFSAMRQIFENKLSLKTT
ncbi:MAG: ATP-binding protein [Planctomycetota bacterium]|jgi:CO dehydrogenase maturation factor